MRHFLLLSLLFLSHILTAQICTTTTLSSQAEVDAFDCVEVDGRLIISGEDITDLSPLSGLTKVNGLIIKGCGNLESLNGLSDLRTILYGLTVRNNDMLRDMTALSSLQDVNSVSIIANDKLEQINSFTELKELRSLEILNNKSLAEIGGFDLLTNLILDLVITENPQLSTCCSLFPAIDQSLIRGNLDISNNASGCDSFIEIENGGPCDTDEVVCTGSFTLTTQEEVNNFSCTTVKGVLTLQGTGIVDIEPLKNLRYTEGLVIHGTSITSTDFLLSLETVAGNLQFTGNPLLSTISLPALKTVSSAVIIKGNDKLERIAEMGTASATGVLEVSDNSSLLSLYGLHNFQNVSGRLTIANNDLIEWLGHLKINGAVSVVEILDMASLKNFGNDLDLTVNSRLTISGNSVLDRIPVFSFSQGAYAEVSNNPLLTTIPPFEGGIPDELLITGNTLLLDCCTLFETVNAMNQAGKIVTIQNNGGNCNTAAILDAGTCDDEEPITCSGDIVLRSQSDVNAFNCESVVGRLTISGDDITDLSPLSVMAYARAVKIVDNPNLTSLNGFGTLAVTNSFIIMNNDQLTSLEGLAGVHSMSNLIIRGNKNLISMTGFGTSIVRLVKLTIQDNAILQSLEGLENIERVVRRIDISNNPVLGTCCSIYPILSNDSSDAEVIIENNASTCTPELIISDGACDDGPGDPDPVTCNNIYVDSQDDLDSFDCDIITGTLTIFGPAVTDISALQGLQKVGNIEILSSGVYSLYPLSTVTEAGNITIYDNDELFTLDGLDGLTVVNSIDISSNDRLESLNGLNNLVQVKGDLKIGFNPNLRSLGGLENIESVGSEFYIFNAPFITSLMPLSNIQTIGGTLNLTSVGMTDLTGLGSLQAVGGLGMESNQNLQSIEQIGSLKVNAGLTIKNNPLLANCCSLAEIAGNNSNTGLWVISGNDLSCNSLDEIRENCLPPDPGVGVVCEGDVYLSEQSDVDAFNCSEIKGNLYIQGANITNLNGLRTLKVVRSLYISNTSITSLSGLENLVETKGEFNINSNQALTDLTGLTSLDYARALWISSNGITSLKGLDNLRETGRLIISNNDVLEEISGFPSLQLTKTLEIILNSNLKRITGFNRLEEISNTLEIQRNDILEYVDGFEQLLRQGGRIQIDENPLLVSIQGMTSLETANNILIAFNDLLSDISGLSGLKLVEGNFTLTNNPSLNDCCILNDLLMSSNIIGNVRILNNDSGCSEESILSNCGMPSTSSPDDLVGGMNDIFSFSAYPNPVMKNGRLHIRFWSENSEEVQLTIASLQGQEMTSRIIHANEGGNDIELDHLNLDSGIYIIYLNGDRFEETIRLLIL